MTSRKSEIGVISGVIISTESETEESDVSISSDSVYDSVAYDPMNTTLSESEAEAQEPTNNKAWNRTL